MLNKLSQEELDTLTRALEPLERLATCDLADAAPADDADCPVDCG